MKVNIVLTTKIQFLRFSSIFLIKKKFTLTKKKIRLNLQCNEMLKQAVSNKATVLICLLN